MTVDKSAIRADLLVECIRHTSNPQVQNTALLLISSLASWSPELVLHNLMPVFTFMGSTLLRQNDDYSAHVVDQVCYLVITHFSMTGAVLTALIDNITRGAPAGYLPATT